MRTKFFPASFSIPLAFAGTLGSLSCDSGDDFSDEELEASDPDFEADVGEISAPPRGHFATLAQHIAICQQDPRVLAGIVNLDVCVGADLFLREGFNGNGRSCATCHPVENNFTIDPAFIATLPANNPLFVAEFNPTLANLERPAQMRARSLILENPDGFAPDPNVRFVLRSVPHNLSMGVSVDRAAADTVTPPEDRTGWSGDGAPGNGELRDFQTGAVIQHYTKRLNRVAGTDFRLPTSGELDRIDLFMRLLGRTNELNLASVALTNSGAEAGRVTFLSAAARCNGCHGNAGANASFGGGGNRNFNTGVETARNTALNAFPRDGGFLGAPANADGSFGDKTFNTPPLIEAADTGPFFHTDTTVAGASANNASSANTIEQAVAFYDTPAFNNSPAAAAGQINLTATEIGNLGRFLRVLNASFNAQMAVARLNGAKTLTQTFGNNHLAVQRKMLSLAKEELTDAFNMLNQISLLNQESKLRFNVARGLIDSAIGNNNAQARITFIDNARNETQTGNTQLGTGLTLQIGQGTLMF